ncbi:MAG: hypothetical protein IPH07_18670 [Deltaproteobacteria bacterium]|nr:hypothetical protein [Deltaproteobacteria bacterium]MBK8238844.1 hypothetical protein [Deltaproteobacteria bacterium]MBK8715726.1 hypothetical protein [Deltaproteobacteria bacterium]MBP7288195.1 hypothetical protein [Nannocystaceae bacterium]
MITASLLLATLATLQPADDEPTAVVGVLPPVAPELAVDQRVLVFETIERELATAAIEVVPRERVDRALAELGAACGNDGGCRGRLATAIGARFVVTTAVAEPKSSDYTVRLEVHDLEQDRVVASFDDVCTICSEADLRRLVQERTLDAKLAIERAMMPAQTTGEPAVEPAPVAPRPVTPTAATVVAPRQPLLHAGWALTGAGIAGTLGGIVLFALAGQRAGCPTDPRGGPCIPLVYRTVVPAAITTATGVAVLGAGIGLVVVGRKRAARATAITPQASTDGVGLVVRGRF